MYGTGESVAPGQNDETLQPHTCIVGLDCHVSAYVDRFQRFYSSCNCTWHAYL